MSHGFGKCLDQAAAEGRILAACKALNNHGEYRPLVIVDQLSQGNGQNVNNFAFVSSNPTRRKAASASVLGSKCSSQKVSAVREHGTRALESHAFFPFARTAIGVYAACSSLELWR